MEVDKPGSRSKAEVFPEDDDAHESEDQADRAVDHHEVGDLDDPALLRIVVQSSEDDQTEIDRQGNGDVQDPDEEVSRWRLEQEATRTSRKTSVGHLVGPVRHLESRRLCFELQKKFGREVLTPDCFERLQRCGGFPDLRNLLHLKNKNIIKNVH